MTGHGAAEDPNDTNVVQKNWQLYHGYDNVPGTNGSLMKSYDDTGYCFTDKPKTISEINSINHLYTSNDVIKNSQTANTGGRKFDGNKLEYGLVPPIGFKAVVEILTIGAQKYERDNWKHVPDGKRRYFDAAMRHLWDWKSGDKYDEETSKNHLAHAICNLMFLLEKDLLTE
jgi:Domain of unknown function (DUF5664)